ncbi:MAG: hypothetical protein IT462_05205 [Planctomycetes bacterium]|nr:hypothetical protein [Planctomycetota bacterium]
MNLARPAFALSFIALFCVSTTHSDDAKTASEWPRVPGNVVWKASGKTPDEYKETLVNGEKLIETSSPEAVAKSCYLILRLDVMGDTTDLFDAWIKPLETITFAAEYLDTTTKKRNARRAQWKEQLAKEQAQPKTPREEVECEFTREMDSPNQVTVSLTLVRKLTDDDRPFWGERWLFECVAQKDGSWRVAQVTPSYARASTITKLEWSPIGDGAPAGYDLNDLFCRASAATCKKPDDSLDTPEHAAKCVRLLYTYASMTERLYLRARPVALCALMRRILSPELLKNLDDNARTFASTWEFIYKADANWLESLKPTVKESEATAVVTFPQVKQKPLKGLIAAIRMTFAKVEKQWRLKSVERGEYVEGDDEEPKFGPLDDPRTLTDYQ